MSLVHRLHISRIDYLLVFLLLFTSMLVHAQIETTTTNYLSNKYAADPVLPYSSTLEYINNSAKGIPIVDGYEFRTETDEFNLEQQQYLLRFNFNSNEERKAYDRVLASNASIYSAMQDEYIQEKIEQDLDNIVELYFSKLEMEHIKNELVILQDRKMVLSKLLKIDSEVNIGQWLSNQDDILEVYEDSMKVQNEIDGLISILFNGSPTTDFDFSDMITIENIESTCASILASGIRSSDVALSIAEENKANAEYDLEIAEGSSWLKFAQIQYQNDDRRSLQQEVSISTSITLPYSANNRIKKNDAAIEVLEAKNKRTIEEEKELEELASYKLNLESSIKEYRYLKKLIEEQKLEETYKSYQKIQNLSPLVLLDLQKSISKYNSKLEGIKKEIYKIYLDILLKSGVLAQTPRKNFLSSAMTQY